MKAPFYTSFFPHRIMTIILVNPLDGDDDFDIDGDELDLLDEIETPHLFDWNHIDSIPFTGLEDMHPVEEIFKDDNLLSLYDDPFGVYAIRHNATHGLLVDDFIPKPEFGDKITEADLQGFCNQAFDALGLKHIPVKITTMVDNAAYSPGLIPRLSFDDRIYINPNYANRCIEGIGSTDIVLSDLAHEIGHYASHMAGGPRNTYESEKFADFISGFLNAKFNVDVDVARKWFQMYYDPNGTGGYPVSEERWDIEAAGYYFGKHATFEDLNVAFKDKHFWEIIKDYNSESSGHLAEIERLRIIQSKDMESKDILRALGLDRPQARNFIAHAIRIVNRR
ncbi:MAG: hypothetical protein IKO26_00095 [Paludibacteraceae bacterium]|nr:hypothetical protein [Paludibacteraceae bacterium]